MSACRATRSGTSLWAGFVLARHVAVGRVRAGPSRNNMVIRFCPPHTADTVTQAHSVYRLPHAIRVSCFLSLPSAGRRHPFIYSTPSRLASCSCTQRPAADEFTSCSKRMSSRAAPTPSPDGQRLSFLSYSRRPAADEIRVPTADARTPAASTSAAAGDRWSAAAARSVHGSTPRLLRLRCGSAGGCVASWTLRPLCAASL
jgi:hypothetical protein